MRAASHIAAVVPGDHAAGVLHEQGQRGRPDLTVWSFFVAVTGAALLATGLVSTYLLERIPHVQDSVAYLFQAKIFATGAFHVPAPPQAVQSFFMEQFLPFYNGTWFSQYPPGHPLMLMLGVLAGAPWLVEPVLSSLALGCIFFLGRRLYGAGVGALAALLGLSSPFWLFLGSSFMSHGTGLFFAATFLLCFARVEDERRAAWPFLAGFLAAMAFITRELTAVGVIGPFVLYVLIFRYRRWRAYLPALAGACLPLAFFLVYNWAQVGSPLSSTYTAWDQNFALGFGDHVSPLGAFTPADGIWNIYQNQSMLAAQLFGWPYGVALAFAFVPFAVCAARRWDYLLLASFAGVVVVHALYWAPGLMYGPRYYYEALPALLLLTARGVVELGRLPLRVWPAFRPGRHPGAGAVLPAVLILGLVSFNLWFYLPAQLPLYRHYNYSSAAELRAVARARVHHALVFVVSHPPGFWASYGNVFFANDPHLRGDIVYARDEGDLNSLLYPYFPGRAHYRLSGTRLRRLP
ncbi:MAG: glycosyltransferase family 39 protein [Chloroflexi bacterium]|nr:glycosyltransferase family 39 protein [Chloroflexota bacterium]